MCESRILNGRARKLQEQAQAAQQSEHFQDE